MTDTETSAAIEALTHRLRQRDEAMRDGAEYADPEVFALEFITAMRGYGWRRNEALAPPKAEPAEAGGRTREEMLAPVRARLDAINAAKQAPREAGAA